MITTLHFSYFNINHNKISNTLQSGQTEIYLRSFGRIDNPLHSHALSEQIVTSCGVDGWDKMLCDKVSNE